MGTRRSWMFPRTLIYPHLDMKEKIYCSQCHNSVFVSISDKTSVPDFLKNEKICLRCLAKGKVMHRNQKIGNCTLLLPEDVNKLIAGIWRPNRTGLPSRRERKKPFG